MGQQWHSLFLLDGSLVWKTELALHMAPAQLMEMILGRSAQKARACLV
jgi:hypothetical protein